VGAGCKLAGFFLGVDGGASKTEVELIGDDGTRLAEASGPGTTLHEPVTAETLDRLTDLIAETCDLGGITRDQLSFAGLGLSGVDFGDELAEQRELLFPRIGIAEERAALVNDGVVALWGGSAEPRTVVLQVGSAFTAAYRDAYGNEQPFDHHNLGQVVELRRDLLMFVARALDGREPDSALVGLVLNHFGIAVPDEYRRMLVRRTFDWTLARRVVDVLGPALEQGDEAARAMIERTAEAYSDDIACMIGKLGEKQGPVDVVLGGGMLRHAPAALREGIAARVSDRHPEATIHEPLLPPAVGGAVMAAHRAGEDVRVLYERLTE